MDEPKTIQLDQVVERYVQIRDKKAQLGVEHAAQMLPLNDALGRLESAILATLQAQGSEGVRTKSGTAFISHSVSITTADKQAFTNWLHSTGNWAVADIRPSKAAIEEFRKENNDIPPGLNWREAIGVGVRRA